MGCEIINDMRVQMRVLRPNSLTFGDFPSTFMSRDVFVIKSPRRYWTVNTDSRRVRFPPPPVCLYYDTDMCMTQLEILIRDYRITICVHQAKDFRTTCDYLC